jgi:hypothetical protein
LDDAEARAGECHRLGSDAGDADADGWYLGHLLAIRWLQGRGGELFPVVDQVARGTMLVHAYAAYIWTGAALLAAEAGDLDAARVALDRILADGLESIPESSVLLPALWGIVEAAVRLEDADAARVAASLLEPYSDLPVMASLGIVCFGAATRSLALSRRTSGDLDGAIALFEHAVARNKQLGHVPMVAITRADFAQTLIERNADGDVERAGQLLDDALATADKLRLDARAKEWRARRSTLSAGHVSRNAGFWNVRVGHELVIVRDSIGMRYLVTLLMHPARDFNAAELAGAVEDGRAQPVLDETARRQYQHRIRELQRDIEEADADADIERASRLRSELDTLFDEVERVVRPGGKSRTFVDATERARTSVQKAIRRALASIESSAPALADALTRSIRTGTTCRFDPVPELPTRWVVETIG